MKRAQTLRGWSGERNRVEDPPAEPKRPAGKKDTKRWCRGKVGREHIFEWVRDERRDFKRMFHGTPTPDHEAWWQLRCSACLKQKEYCTGMFNKCACGRHMVGKGE